MLNSAICQNVLTTTLNGVQYSLTIKSEKDDSLNHITCDVEIVNKSGKIVYVPMARNCYLVGNDVLLISLGYLNFHITGRPSEDGTINLKMIPKDGQLKYSVEFTNKDLKGVIDEKIVSIDYVFSDELTDSEKKKQIINLSKYYKTATRVTNSYKTVF